MFWLIPDSFGQTCQQEKQNKMATKDRTLVASIFGLISFLNTSINKKPFFVSEVVTNNELHYDKEELYT